MKTLVVGFTPDPRGEEALVLAKTLAGAGDTAILVCVVTPEVWGYPSLANVDQEYGRFLGEYATAAMAQARAALGDIPHLRFERVSARSATVGSPSAICFIWASDSTVSSRSSIVRTGDLLVKTWLMKRCLRSTMEYR